MVDRPVDSATCTEGLPVLAVSNEVDIDPPMIMTMTMPQNHPSCDDDLLQSSPLTLPTIRMNRRHNHQLYHRTRSNEDHDNDSNSNR